MSRPKSEYPYEPINVYLYAKHHDWLRKKVTETKVNRSEIIRRLIDKQIRQERYSYEPPKLPF